MGLRKPTFKEFLESIATTVITFGVYYVYDMNKNIGTLNAQVAVLISKQESYSTIFDKLDERQVKQEERQRMLELRLKSLEDMSHKSQCAGGKSC